MTASPSAFTVPDEQALYLFCLVRAAAPAVQHEGLSGTAVQRVRVAEGLEALVDRVPRDEWAGPQADDNMKSIEWVAPRATLHEEVVEAAMEAGPVYPARFGTLYSSTERLQDTVTARRDTIDEFLARVETADEWAVKGLLDRDQAASHLAARAGPSEADPHESGTAYLKRRKQEQEARRSVDAWLEETSTPVKETLQNLADRFNVLDPRRTTEANAEYSIALNWALLVDEGRRDALRRRIRQANADHEATGLQFRLTGPWPPYSFRPQLPESSSENSAPIST